ncbi:MAG TPA: type II secretion system minor pseudopilin GspI [Burkholderiaceae bacterium]|nr:type II secretion system minor pseudopilin GspI [Burkholderiaceae bacterium]
MSVRARGFTLIEVLVALTVVSVALAASLRAAGSMMINAEALRLKQYATWSAENRLAELRVARQYPALGSREFACPQGRAALLCVEEVKQTLNPIFRRVEISVFSNASREQKLMTLVTVLPNQQ